MRSLVVLTSCSSSSSSSSSVVSATLVTSEAVEDAFDGLVTRTLGMSGCFLDGATVCGGGGGLGERKMDAVEETLSISSDSPRGSSMVSLGCVYSGL